MPGSGRESAVIANPLGLPGSGREGMVEDSGKVEGDAAAFDEAFEKKLHMVMERRSSRQCRPKKRLRTNKCLQS